MAPPLAAPRFHAALPRRLRPQKLIPSWRRVARPDDEDYYFVDDSIGDGFVRGNMLMRKDRAYPYRNVLPVLLDKYHSIASDWLGFGFSDKPQPKYGFDYTLDEYTSSLQSLINAVAPDKLSIVVQGYFAPTVVKYANEHQDKLNHLIVVNPPITDEDAKLPCTLACFSVFLLGEIFSQDPLGASDKALISSGPYMIEEDATVYRRPYLVSGSSGFALNAIKRAIGKDLKVYTESMRSILASDSWNAKTTISWGLRDRWLSYDGVEDFCRGLKHKFVELPMAGHHVQEDRGEELGNIIKRILRGQNVAKQL